MYKYNCIIDKIAAQIMEFSWKETSHKHTFACSKMFKLKMQLN